MLKTAAINLVLSEVAKRANSGSAIDIVKGLINTRAEPEAARHLLWLLDIAPARVFELARIAPAGYWLGVLQSGETHRKGEENAREFIAGLYATYGGMKFSHDWFGSKIAVWTEILRPLRKRPLRVLEVGVFEGRSVAFLMEYVPKSTVVALDHHVLKKGWTSTQGITLEWDTEDAFDENTARYGKRVEKIVAPSAVGLARLVDEKREFDVIYIDAGHTEEEALTDSRLAWDMLAPDGLLIWDDFLLDLERAEFRPTCFGICKWLQENPGKWEIVHAGWQLMVRKIA